MAVFAVHTVVHRDHMPVMFGPGDEVPSWAEGLVGDHVIAPAGKVPAPKADSADEERPEREPDSASLDFTKAAPKRRGRPAKGQG